MPGGGAGSARASLYAPALEVSHDMRAARSCRPSPCAQSTVRPSFGHRADKASSGRSPQI